MAKGLILSRFRWSVRGSNLAQPEQLDEPIRELCRAYARR